MKSTNSQDDLIHFFAQLQEKREEIEKTLKNTLLSSMQSQIDLDGGGAYSGCLGIKLGEETVYFSFYVVKHTQSVNPFVFVAKAVLFSDNENIDEVLDDLLETSKQKDDGEIDAILENCYLLDAEYTISCVPDEN